MDPTIPPSSQLSSQPSSQSKKAAPRKRGAQPGNRNALKHGFYARHFRLSELNSLEHVQNGLRDEIDLLRLAMQRLIALATAQDSEAAEWQKTLQALGVASQRLAKLVQIHRQLTAEQDLESDALVASIRRAVAQRDWGADRQG